jgi:hypothetical protein
LDKGYIRESLRVCLFKLLLLLLGSKSSSWNKHLNFTKRCREAMVRNVLVDRCRAEAGRGLLPAASRASRKWVDDSILGTSYYLRKNCHPLYSLPNRYAARPPSLTRSQPPASPLSLDMAARVRNNSQIISIQIVYEYL